MGFPLFDIVVDSGDLAARSALAQVLCALSPLDLTAEETASVQLVVAEVVNNIVEHAFSNGAGPIRLRGTCMREGLHIRVTDSGAAMPQGRLPPGNARNVDVDVTDLPEGGFGWSMIRDLAKDIRYSRKDGHNRLDLRIAVGLNKSR